MESPDSNNTATRVDPVPFRSPMLSSGHISSKFNDDTDRLTFALAQAVPEATRQAVRSHWKKCLLGSEFHQAFVLNASIHHANDAVIKRSIKDFGSRMVSEAKHQIADILSPSDLDDVADAILSKASNDFLDRALQKRLFTIEARSLVDALSRAGRLGYDLSDIVNQATECVVPVAPVHVPSTAPRPTAPTQRAASSSRFGSGNLNCGECGRVFGAVSAQKYHIDKRVCRRVPPSEAGFPHCCPHCGQGFTTLVGLNYHITNKVCGDFIIENADVGLSTTPVEIRPSIDATPEINATASTVHGETSVPPQAPLKPIQTPAKDASCTAPGGSPPFMTASQTEWKTSYDELSPKTRQSLMSELEETERKFEQQLHELHSSVNDPESRAVRMASLKNSLTAKQSLLRKKYGLSLRVKGSQGVSHLSNRQRTNTNDSVPQTLAAHAIPGSDGPSAKRQRMSLGVSDTLRMLPVAGVGSLSSIPVPAARDAGTFANGNFVGSLGLGTPKLVNLDQADATHGPNSSNQSNRPIGGSLAGNLARPSGGGSNVMVIEDDDMESSEGGDGVEEDIPAELPSTTSYQRASSRTFA